MIAFNVWRSYLKFKEKRYTIVLRLFRIRWQYFIYDYLLNLSLQENINFH